MNEATRAFHLVGVGKPLAKEAALRSSGLEQLATYMTSHETAVPRQAEKLIKDIANGTEGEVLIVFNASRDRAAAVRVPEKINVKNKLNHFVVKTNFLPNIREAVRTRIRIWEENQYPGVAVIEKYNEPDNTVAIRVTSINGEVLMKRNDPLLHVIRKTQAELNHPSPGK